MKAAQTPEERHEATKNFQKSMRNATLTIDPSLVEILDKIKPAKQDFTPNSTMEMAQ
jgi:hypothetical protein